MKKVRIILLLFLVFILAAAVWFLSKDDNTEEKQEEKTESILVREIPGKIDSMTLINQNGYFSFAKKNDLWYNIFSYEVETKGNTIFALESIIKKTLAEDLIEENVKSLSKYGLENPLATLKCTSENGEYYICIGNDVVGSKYYFTLDKVNVYTMDFNEAKLFFADMNSFIELALSSFAVDDINSVVICQDIPIVVEKKNEAEFSDKRADSLFVYGIKSPVIANAEPNAVQKLYEGVSGIWATSFIPDANDEDFGFDYEKDYFEIVTQEGKKRFYIGKIESNGYCYIKKEGTEGVFKVSESALDFMKFQPFDLIDKHIFLYYMEEVSKIVISSSEGTYDIILGNTPSVNGREVEPQKITEFYKNIISLSYDGILGEEKPLGEEKLSISFYTENGIDKASYYVSDAMNYAVIKEGVSGFTIQQKYIEKIFNIVKEL